MKEYNYHTSPNITCEQIVGKESEQMRSPGPGNLHVEITLSMLLPKGPFTCKFERMRLKISIGKGIFSFRIVLRLWRSKDTLSEVLLWLNLPKYLFT